ncbi:hypothetical protein SAMN05443575_3383 [Jatrophihabitans endophyticus]|uniref:DUF5667 domain-containing protein n=1 Tax=Jatrophihabitans endophyticus TaxID=1206085 RepID=A0A1M5QYE2_9ACTN|nr:DUF5667 domain-containing protein [Jatrophihabitans endophyticus]SHH18729.1 hypothetical protein SAMN05443575_3383 [Jatrophihabitans endophyticus]
MADERRTRTGGRGFRRVQDPTTSTDPRVVAVLDELARLPVAPAPRPEFRAELRAQLVAIAPRIVAESADDPTTVPGAATRPTAVADTTPAAGGSTAVLDRPRPSPRPRPGTPAVPSTGAERTRRRRRVPLARPLAVAASVVTVLALVLGGAVWLSRDAVPGDTLYGLKRTSERVELSFADDDADRARYHLQFAQTRVEEARTLVSRATAAAAGGRLQAGGLSPETSHQVTDTLTAADDDTRAALRLLGATAVQAGSADALRGMQSWWPGQLDRLARLRKAVPAGTSARSSATRSMTVLRTAAARVKALDGRVGCRCLQHAPSDSYGPVPTRSRPSGTHPTSPAPAPTARRSHAPGSSPTTAARHGTTGTAGSRKPTTAAPRTSTRRLPRLPLPTLTAPPTSRRATSAPLDLCTINLLGVRICPSK